MLIIVHEIQTPWKKWEEFFQERITHRMLTCKKGTTLTIL
jgi:hypothetical protein